MNGFCGIIHFDGRPVDPDVLHGMAETAAPRGFRSEGRWMEEGAGFAFRMLSVTPQARHETLPVMGAGGRFVMVATARIDNREDLFSALDVPGPARSTTSDADLMLAAFMRWGEGFPDRILGDWAAAIWDRHERRLLLARDHIGLANLTYYSGPGVFVFATTLRGVLACPEVPRKLDELVAAKTLTAWPVDDGATIYSDVRRLEPAHLLLASERGTERRRYWRLADAPDVRFANDEDYPEAFLEQFSRAVRCCLVSEGKVGTTLSGGLDSGAVSAVAARELKGRGETLEAFTSVPIHPLPEDLPSNRFGDEGPHAELVAAMAGNIRLHRIEARDRSPLEGLRRWVDVHGEPAHGAVNLFWIEELFETASNQGIKAVLIGQKGNATISWAGSGNIQTLLRRFRWLELVRELLAERRETGRSLFRAAGSEIVLPLLREFLVRAPLPVNRDADLVLKYSGIKPRFARRLDLFRLMREEGHGPRHSRKLPDRQRRLRLMELARTPVGGHHFQSGAAAGLEIRDPTRDKKLMEFCVGLPWQQYAYRGTRRRLIRRSLGGVLPDRVLANQAKGLQAADLIYRLRDSRGEIEEVLRILDGDNLAREILDIPRMRDIALQIPTRNDMELFLDCSAILLRSMAVGLSLPTLQSRPPGAHGSH